MMDKFLISRLLDREIDVFCGPGASYSGIAKSVVDGVLLLEKDGVQTYIAIDKIISVSPTSQSEASSSRP